MTKTLEELDIEEGTNKQKNSYWLKIKKLYNDIRKNKKLQLICNILIKYCPVTSGIRLYYTIFYVIFYSISVGLTFLNVIFFIRLIRHGFFDFFMSLSILKIFVYIYLLFVIKNILEEKSTILFSIFFIIFVVLVVSLNWTLFKEMIIIVFKVWEKIIIEFGGYEFEILKNSYGGLVANATKYLSDFLNSNFITNNM